MKHSNYFKYFIIKINNTNFLGIHCFNLRFIAYTKCSINIHLLVKISNTPHSPANTDK